MTFSGVQIEVHREPEGLWAVCPACPGWSAAADSWDDLFRLVSEHHAEPDARHGWWMVEPLWSLSRQPDSQEFPE